MPLDKESEAVVTQLGLPPYNGMTYLHQPERQTSSPLGRSYLVFARGYRDLYSLGLDGSGKVWALPRGAENCFVNSTLGQFAKSLHAYGSRLAEIRLAEDGGNIGQLKSIHADLVSELRQIDPAALSGRSWWTSALEELS
jgi:hypothetical protein